MDGTAVTASEPKDSTRRTTVTTSSRTRNHRHKNLETIGGRSTHWGDYSFKLRSYVSVPVLPLGKMMEEAELAAHANAWQPSTPVSQDMDVQLRYLLVMLTSGPALQRAVYKHSKTLLADIARVRKHVPWHSSKSSCTVILVEIQTASQTD